MGSPVHTTPKRLEQSERIRLLGINERTFDTMRRATPLLQETVDAIVGGFGGMMRFTPFGGQKDPILKLCRSLYDEGVICFYCGHGPFHVRMLPPLGVMPESQWPEVFAIVERAMAKVHAESPASSAAAARPMVKPYKKS